MSKAIILLSFLLPVIFCLTRKELVDYASKQYTRLSQTLKTGIEYPFNGDPVKGWQVRGPGVFDSPMYPGVLWHLYHLTQEEKWKHLAIQGTDGCNKDQFITNSHDIGVEIAYTYGLGYDFTKNNSYPDIIINGAKHMATRFNEKVGCIRSWNSPKNPGEFWVIVDNMVNLELLFRAHLLSGNKTYYDMAVSHTNKTIENHLRTDYSSWHVVAFNETTGAVVRKFTAQGYSDSSCWAMGQAFLINGFMTAYNYTKMAHILEAAKNVADYYVERLPEDSITYWDFDVPKDKYPYIPRDTSSAAIATSGLFELYIHTNQTKYLTTAQKIMNSLFSSKYRADGKPEYKIPALVVNATYRGPNAAHGKSDIALTFADYYYAASFKYIK